MSDREAALWDVITAKVILLRRALIGMKHESFGEAVAELDALLSVCDDLSNCVKIGVDLAEKEEPDEASAVEAKLH